MSDLMPGEDGFDETRGWDRALIAFRSRKPYLPDIGREDLLLPNEATKLRALALCSSAAARAESAPPARGRRAKQAGTRDGAIV